MTNAVVEYYPNRNLHTCDYVLDPTKIERREDGVLVFNDATIDALRRGLTESRFNFMVDDVESVILKEDEKTKFITIKLQGVEKPTHTSTK